jgi:hypothetical protein
MQTSYAGTSRTVNPARNGVYETMRISWTVSNAPTCAGTTDYPETPSITIKNWWQQSLPSSGTSQSFNVDAAPGTYTFTCTENTYGTGIQDTSTLTVRGCEVYGANYVWYQDGCYIAPTLGNLIYTPNTAPDVDYNETATLSWDGVSNVTSCTLTGGEFSSFSVGTSATGNRVTSPLTANTSYTLTCTGAGGQVSRNVTIPVASGTINAAPLVCVIPDGQNSCPVLLSWSTVNMSSPRVTNTDDTTLSIAPNNSNSSFSAYYGNTIFSIKNDSVTHDSVTVNAACDAAAPWNGVICTSSQSASTASIHSATCYILSGQSTCSASVIWRVTNPTGVVTVTRQYDSNSVFATGTAGTLSATFPYAPTPYILDLRDNGVVRSSGSFTARCVDGTSWNGSVCYPTSGSVSGTLNDASCTIALGANSCQALVTWSTANSVGLVTITDTLNTQLYSGISGNQTRVFQDVGSTILNLKIDGVVIDSGTFSRSCQIGTSWNGSACGASNVAVI